MWKKGGKEKIFPVLGVVKNMIFEKRGGGKNINYFDNMHPCIKLNCFKCSLEFINNEEIIERSIFIYFLYEERSIFELLFVLISDLIFIDDPLL